GLDAVDREGDLEIDRLLAPQRAVVVEGGDAFIDRDEIRAARRRHARDKIDDRRLRRAVVPGRQRVGLRLYALAGKSAKCSSQERGEDAAPGECWCLGHDLSVAVEHVQRPGVSVSVRSGYGNFLHQGLLARGLVSIVLGAHGLLPSRTTQRKPTWLVEVSTGSAWRAAGR